MPDCNDINYLVTKPRFPSENVLFIMFNTFHDGLFEIKI